MARTWLPVLMLLVLALPAVIPGCSPSASAGEELRVGMVRDIGSLDPRDATGYTRNSWLAGSLIYETLTALGPDLVVVPRLAESWEQSGDGLAWTFKLRRDVKFSDGTSFDAGTVVFNYEYQSPQLEKNFVGAIERVEAVDSHTVRFSLRRPYAPLASDLTCSAYFPIIGPGSLDSNGTFLQPIGTGPFVLQAHQKGAQVALDRNPDYWGGAPDVRRLLLKVIPDPSTRVMALEAGEVDMIGVDPAGTPYEEVERLGADPKLVVAVKPGVGIEMLGMNARKTPLDEVLVRRAIAHAIDVDTAVVAVLGETAYPVAGPVSPASRFAAEHLQAYEYDPWRAVELLEEDGWTLGAGGIRYKGGQPLKLELIFDSRYSEYQNIAPVIQAQLRDVGLDVTLSSMEMGAWSQAIQRRQFDLALIPGIGTPSDDPHGNFRFFYHSAGAYSIYGDPEVDTMVDRLTSATGEDERMAAYHELQERLVDACPAVFLYNRQVVVVHSEKLKGFQVSAAPWDGLGSLRSAHLE